MIETCIMIFALYAILGVLSLFILTWYSPCEDLEDLLGLIAMWWYTLILIGLYEWDSYRTWPDTYQFGKIYRGPDTVDFTFE